jgi:hypothetical protein
MSDQSVKAFISDSYQLITASSPTVPLHGDDVSKGLQFLNELVSSFSATGLLTPIAQLITYPLSVAQEFVTFGPATLIPTPNVTLGRLSNLQNSWLLLDNVTYPLIDESRNTFFASYKYDPQLGLPRFVIITNDLNLTTMRLYPAPSQYFLLNVYGKFEPPPLTENSDMSSFPTYQRRFLRFALAKDLSFYKGRTEAWTEKLESEYNKSEKDIYAVSSVNLNIETEQESYLNGSWRVRAGV